MIKPTTQTVKALRGSGAFTLSEGFERPIFTDNIKPGVSQGKRGWEHSLSCLGAG